jgi:hypothetical protein
MWTPHCGGTYIFEKMKNKINTGRYVDASTVMLSVTCTGIAKKGLQDDNLEICLEINVEFFF